MESLLIGRKTQISQLEAARQSTKPEMVALVGRRRVGKTYLVRQVYGKHIRFQLTGLQDGNTDRQLRNFALSMDRYFPKIEIGMPEDWLSAFHQLGKALNTLPLTEKPIVFLDELPWLATRKSGFISALGYFWNNWASQRPIVLVVCGSAASWMIRKVINDRGGLHNRVTRLLYLFPFSLAETESYCLARNIRLSRFQLLQIYQAMGGIPMYLDQLEPGSSAVQNIQRICFQETGYLRHEFERLFASLFANFEHHVEIVRLLADKRRGITREEIIKKSNLSNGGGLSTTLDELEKSGFITAYGGYKKKKRDQLYRLTDLYTHFYLTYLEPLGKSARPDFTKLSDLPKYKAWAGYAYETICLTHIDTIRQALSIAGMSSTVASFIATATDDLPGTQIDLLIDRSDQSINLCEIKFSVQPIRLTKAMAENLEAKKRVFAHHTGTRKHLFTTLVTSFGVAPSPYLVSHVDQVLTLDDLFV